MPIIHHIVLGNDVPELNRECIDSWARLKALHFEFMQWTDESAATFLATCDLEHKRLFDKARNYGEASDILRMAITHHFGGIYVDWDVLLLDPGGFLKTMGDLTETQSVFLEDRKTQERDHSSVYTNSLFYIKRGSPLPVAFLAQIKDDYTHTPMHDTPNLTEPLAFTRFLNLHPIYKKDSRILNLTDVYSFAYSDVRKVKIRETLKAHSGTTSAPAIHFWTHFWMAPQKRGPVAVAKRALRALGERFGLAK